MTGLRILLVDDETECTNMLSLRLTRRGFQTASAESGEKAIDYLSEHEVDIIVMDVKMPGMGGIAALDIIHKQYPSVPVIMLSGHADMTVAVEGMRLGAFGYLMKPTDFDELLYKIEDAHQQSSLDKKAGNGL